MATRRVNEVVERLSKLSEEEMSSRQFSVLERLLLNSDDPDKGVAFALDMMLAGIDTVRTPPAPERPKSKSFVRVQVYRKIRWLKFLQKIENDLEKFRRFF